MNTWPIQDMSGRVIGSISLENEEIPNAIMDEDTRFMVGGAWSLFPKRFVNFYLIPNAMVATVSIKPEDASKSGSSFTQMNDPYKKKPGGE